jgi:uncharacterized protein YjgD (DUF1641 family)
MAQPITLEMPPRDPRAELQLKLQSAPLQHAEALLSAYDVLQRLHDSGLLEVLRGALGSSDKLIQLATESAGTPQSIRGIRNLVVLAKILGTIEPDLVEGFARSLPEAIALTKAYESKPPGLWGILKRFRNKDFRRGLVLVNSMLEAFGRNLPPDGGGQSRLT